MSAYAVIREAILSRQCLTATYKNKIRKISPHCLGLDKKGEPHLLAFQYDGGSTSGLPYAGEWRCLKVDEIAAITVNTDEWHTANSSGRGNNCAIDIDVEVR